MESSSNRMLFSSFCLFLLLLSLISPTLGLQIEVIIENHVTCYGGNDGIATVTITEGSPPYKVFWGGLDESGYSVQLPSGFFNVSVTDSNKNQVTKVFVMSQPSRLEGGAYTYSSTSSCDKLGSISALAHGGTPPYTYSWQGEKITVLTAVPSFTVFDEILSPEFNLVDDGDNVDLHSDNIEAYSGLYSVKVKNAKNFKFLFSCSSSNPVCIQSDLYRGIQFWLWKEEAEGLLFAGLINKDGVIEQRGVTNYSFTASTWTMGFLDFSAIPNDMYSGIYFATNGAHYFHLDDIVLLPKSEDFEVSNTSIASLPIGTPSAIYAPGGQYDLRIEDSNKCPLSLNLNIVDVPSLKSAIKVDGHTISILTNGGTPPYTYNITGPNSTTLSSQQGTFENLEAGNYTIEVVDSRTCRNTNFTQIGSPLTPIPPPSAFDNYKVFNTFLAVLAGLFAFMTLLLSILIHKRRNDLRPHSLLFCQIILIGAMIGYIAAILAVLEVSWDRSIAFSWTVDVSVTIIYGSMFAKSMQILKILDNFTKFVSIDTTDRYMTKVFSFIIVPELILLIVWTILTSTTFRNKLTAGQSEVIFWNVFLIYKGIVGFLASFVCFRMRFKFKEYLEIQQIAYCHFSMEIVLVFMLIFTLIARERYSELFVGIQSLAVFVIVTIPLFVIIGPILSRAVKDYREEKRTNKWRSLPMYS